MSATNIPGSSRRTIAAAIGCLGLAASPTLADVIHGGGSISTPTTWSAADSDHIVTGTIQITQSGALTIEEGCTVRFEDGVRLDVSGTLVAEGGASGILFTQRDPGDAWRGIFFFHTGDGTISDCTIEDASSAAGVEVQQSANVTIQDCTIRECDRGVRVFQGSGPTITGCTIENNVTGIRYDQVTSPSLTVANTLQNNTTGVRLVSSPGATIDSQTITGSNGADGAIAIQQGGEFTLGPGNVITGNSWGLSIDVGSAPSLASAGNIPLAGNTNDDGIQVRGGAAFGNVTWRDLGADYIVIGGAVVNGSVLTIDQGCTIRFDQSSYLYATGTVNAVGGVPGILFTRRDDGESWGGLQFFAANGTLENCTIEHASGPSAAGVFVQQSTVTLDSCVIRSCTRGIRAKQGQPPVISGCTIEDNAIGIRFEDIIAPSLSAENTLTNNDTGVFFSNCTSLVVDNQTITGSTSSDGAIVVNRGGEFTLGPGNVVTGNSWGLSIDTGCAPSLASSGNIPLAGNTNFDGIQVRGGTTNATVTWHDLGVSYIVTDQASVGNSGHLTIADGVSVLFDANAGLTIVGGIEALGDTLGIVFRRRNDPNAWNGLYFWTGEGIFRNCSFWGVTQFAGAAALHADGGTTLELEDCSITQNDYGVRVNNSSASMFRCVVTDNASYGVRLSGSATVDFGADLTEWNDIYGNGGGELGRQLHNGSEDISARYVYWGTTDESAIEAGVYHEPDNSSLGPVTYEPWTNEDHTSQIGVPFADVTPPGQLDTVTAVGGSWGDYDNDGDPDLFVAAHGPNKLLRNDGGIFVDATPAAFGDDAAYQTLTAAWGDLENDGDLDLLVANFDGPTRLYRNENPGWVVAGLQPTQFHWGAAWGDVFEGPLDGLYNDGDLDLILVPSTGAPAQLWKNHADGTITYDSDIDGTDFAHHAAWADFDGDGNTDLAVAGSLGGAPEVTFLRNEGHSLSPIVSYTNVGNTHYRTVAWADVDNDGAPDAHVGGYDFADILVCSDGQAPTPCTPPELADAGIASSGSWGDFDNDGRIDLYLTKSDGANRLFQNLGTTGFSDVAAGELASTSANSGAAWADTDGDGDLDLFVAGLDGASRLLRNDVPAGNHWLHVDLRGVFTNRFGFGTKITVHAGGTVYVHEVSTGSGNLAQNSITAEFGLGTTTVVDSVVVAWRSGDYTYGPFAVDQRITLTEQISLISAFGEFPVSITEDRGASWGDYDGDGDDDVYFAVDDVNGDPNVMLRNDAGSLIPVSIPIIELTDRCAGSAWGDFDDDGHLDLLVSRRVGSLALFENTGGGSFADVTPTEMDMNVACGIPSWADVDMDGDLDAYVCAYGGPKRLFRNDGGSSFANVTTGALADGYDERYAAWGDYDDDGDPDLFSCRVDAVNALLRNDNGAFVDVTDELPVATSDAYNAVWMDLESDGDLDLYVTMFDGGSKLFRNDGAQGFADATTPTLAVESTVGSHWIDYDNDGDLDLYTGFFRQLLRNDGGSFADVSHEIFSAVNGFGGIAWADFNEDGGLDALEARSAPFQPRMYRNTMIHGGNWIRLHLEGTVSNRSGIGARVRVVTGDLWQTRELTVHGDRYSQSSLVVHVGLGEAETIDRIAILWPSGIRQLLTDVPVNVEMTIVEEATVNVEIVDATAAVALSHGYPNPFRSTTRIAFGLPEPADVRLRIFDVGGRLVRVLANDVLSAGRHDVAWDGRDEAGRRVGTGVYFFRLEAADHREQRRLVRIE